MAERTPEQINRVVGGITILLPHGVDFTSADHPLQSAIRAALYEARLQGVLDGILYARGEGELPADVADSLKGIEVMSRYLSPRVLGEVLGLTMPESGESDPARGEQQGNNTDGWNPEDFVGG